MGNRKKFNIRKYEKDREKSLTMLDWINDTEKGIGIRPEKEIIKDNKRRKKEIDKNIDIARNVQKLEKYIIGNMNRRV